MQLPPVLEKFDRLASRLQAPLLLIVRLYWGWSFTQTGWGKLMNLERTAGYFESLHLPWPKLNALAAGSVECFGGLLLALGLFARPAAVPLVFTMIVAYATADHEAVRAIFSDPEQFTGAAPFPFLLAALVVLAFGPGRFSLDALMSRKAR